MESLSRLADEIMAVKAKSVPVIPCVVRLFARNPADQPPNASKWTYKLPNRVVYNETMRQSFIADLVNPNFPLQRLARSIPHGYRGNDLLEMLYARSVPFDRAAWLVQALGAHEVVSGLHTPVCMQCRANLRLHPGRDSEPRKHIHNSDHAI